VPGNYDRIARFYDVDMARNMAFDDVGFYADVCRRNGGRALEMGCGNGRILLSLLNRGLDAVGVDRSSAMLHDLMNRARSQALPARVALMDARSLAFDRAFGVILLPYSLITYITSDDDVMRTLSEARRVLRPGGWVVVDAFVPRPVAEHAEFRPDYRRPFGDCTLARSKRVSRIDAQHNRIERRYQVLSRDDELIEQVDIVEEIRPFAPDELTERLVAAGFAIHEKWWDYEHSEERSPAQFFTAVARAG
jgi:SAM-dependent methyltransferase